MIINENYSTTQKLVKIDVWQFYCITAPLVSRIGHHSELFEISLSVFECKYALLFTENWKRKPAEEPVYYIFRKTCSQVRGALLYGLLGSRVASLVTPLLSELRY
jgi:hypothetical protein